MLDKSVFSVSLGLLAFSYLPTASAALSWSVCTKDAEGKEVCRDRVARGARISMAIACLFVLILLATLTICILRHRRAAAASEKEYNVEASQVEGPPTIIATSYDPSSGRASPVYGGKKSGNPDGGLSPHPQMTGPIYPAAAHQYNNNSAYYGGPQNFTAPVSQVAFPNQPYPFTGYSPGMGPSAPKTAFVSGGFPRPLLAGDRLKDRIKERPASISSLAPTLPEYQK